MDVGYFVEHYGYIAVFLGTLLEGETWVALAGFAVYQGYLKMHILIPIAVVGAVLGDQAFFLFGRYKGKAYLEKRPQLAEKVARAHVLIEKYQNALIIGSRFMYGFRTVLPIALGTSKVSHTRFLILNIIGAVVWAHLFAFGGYAFGGAIETFLGNMKKFEWVLALVLVVIIALAQFIFWRRRKRRAHFHKFLDNDTAATQ